MTDTVSLIGVFLIYPYSLKEHHPLVYNFKKFSF